MALTGSHATGETGHIGDHNALDVAVAALQAAAAADKAVTAAYRFRVPGGEEAPTATNWEERPSGYKTVIAVGALPSPADAQAGDFHDTSVT